MKMHPTSDQKHKSSSRPVVCKYRRNYKHALKTYSYCRCGENRTFRHILFVVVEERNPIPTCVWHWASLGGRRLLFSSQA